MRLRENLLLKAWSVLNIALVTHVGAVEAPRSLTTANFEQVKAYVVGGEQRFLEVDWQSTVLDGHNQGLKADKPILLWLYFGGPMGNC